MTKLNVNTLELFRLWNSEMRNDELCVKLGVPVGTLWMLRKRFKLPKRREGSRVPTRPETAAPSPDEIAEMTAQIRAGWPAGEAERRLVGCGRRSWSLPSYAFDGRGCAFTETYQS